LNWARQRVIVTGGAGFIGGALVDRLLTLGADVTVVDKIFLANQPTLFAEKLKRLDAIFKRHGIAVPKLQTLDLSTQKIEFELLARHCDVVFHLSAVFGGREFVNTRQADCAKMFAVDHNVIDAASSAGVKKLHYASSACVYPDSLQTKGSAPLKEIDALSTGEGFKGADNIYGWAKLMGEQQLQVYHKERGLEGSTCRYLTVYGPGELDTSHAVPALVEKALAHQDPFVIWGTGKQQRGFTYVDDIVDGSIRACERITDGIPINLGSPERLSIDEVASQIFEASHWKPARVRHDYSKPEGPFARSLSIDRAFRVLDWTPKIHFHDGIQTTVAWHRSQKLEVAAKR
jgi:UDP-glucose 4-epimerase